jgi:hypothetical protein
MFFSELEEEDNVKSNQKKIEKKSKEEVEKKSKKRSRMERNRKILGRTRWIVATGQQQHTNEQKEAARTA